MLPNCTIGIFGGSGFYSLFDNAKEIEIDTPFGKPSDKIAIGKITGKDAAFLPRHGKTHAFSPSAIPYKANLWAFKQLGVKHIISPAASGSLQPNINPGDFVICDQFIDRTKRTQDSFYNQNQKVLHISLADPYCDILRGIAIQECEKLKINVHKNGTVVVIEGPRFSSKAESRWFSNSGFHVINMTQYPEVALARELEMCYLNISLITDRDAGIDRENVKPVSAAEVAKIFKANNKKLKGLIYQIIKNTPANLNCSCHQALSAAKL